MDNLWIKLIAVTKLFPCDLLQLASELSHRLRVVAATIGIHYPCGRAVVAKSENSLPLRPVSALKAAKKFGPAMFATSVSDGWKPCFQPSNITAAANQQSQFFV